MKKIKTSKKYLIIVLIVVVIGGSYYFFSKPKQKEITTATAKITDLAQIVSATGKVKTTSEVGLSFEKSGRIHGVLAEAGEKVKTGTLLVFLDNDDLQAQKNQASATTKQALADLEQHYASLESQNAKLSEMKAGSRPEELKIKKSETESAQSTLNESKNNLEEKIKDAFTKSDDAVRNKADQMFDNSRTSSPNLSFTADYSSEKSLEWKRFIAENTLNSWKTEIDSWQKEQLQDYFKNAQSNLSSIKSFLEEMAFAVNSLTPTASLSSTVISGWKTDISSARTNIATAISNLNTAGEKYTSAESSLSIAKNKLALAEAGYTKEQLAVQEALIKQSQANINSQKEKIKQMEASEANAQAQLTKSYLYSPIDGVVSKQDAKVGEMASANKQLVYVISENDFKIEVNIPESDIAKIKKDNLANITLDAYGDEVVFEAFVHSVDPAETIIEGVSTYKVILYFKEKDERVKSGMTANLEITTDTRKNVLAVPKKSVIEKGGIKIVRVVLENGSIKETEVKTGLRASDGNVEILSGLNNGDTIATFIKD